MLPAKESLYVKKSVFDALKAKNPTKENSDTIDGMAFHQRFLNHHCDLNLGSLRQFGRKRESGCCAIQARDRDFLNTM
jgi:hypothetical protein